MQNLSVKQVITEIEYLENRYNPLSHDYVMNGYNVLQLLPKKVSE